MLLAANQQEALRKIKVGDLLKLFESGILKTYSENRGGGGSEEMGGAAVVRKHVQDIYSHFTPAALGTLQIAYVQDLKTYLFLDGHNRFNALLYLLRDNEIRSDFEVDIKVTRLKSKDEFVEVYYRLNKHYAITALVASTISDSGFAKYLAPLRENTPLFDRKELNTTTAGLVAAFYVARKRAQESGISAKKMSFDFKDFYIFQGAPDEQTGEYLQKLLLNSMPYPRHVVEIVQEVGPALKNQFEYAHELITEAMSRLSEADQAYVRNKLLKKPGFMAMIVADSFKDMDEKKVYNLMTMPRKSQIDLLSDLWRRSRWTQAYSKLQKAMA